MQSMLSPPYEHHGMWVFDDPRVGLVQEPLVAGADAMIDRVVADFPDTEHGFTLIFSGTPFPGHQYRLFGGAEKAVATGTTRRSLTWKAGSALRCSSTSKKCRSSYTSKFVLQVLAELGVMRLPSLSSSACLGFGSLRSAARPAMSTIGTKETFTCS